MRQHPPDGQISPSGHACEETAERDRPEIWVNDLASSLMSGEPIPLRQPPALSDSALAVNS